MQVNKKLNILQQTRDLNRKETRLALRKRKVRLMQQKLTDLDEDMKTATAQSERNALEHEAQVRLYTQFFTPWKNNIHGVFFLSNFSMHFFIELIVYNFHCKINSFFQFFWIKKKNFFLIFLNF